MQATTPASDRDLDALAGAGRLWDLAGAAKARLDRDPGDAPARTFLAAALLALGVPELAVECARDLECADADAIRRCAAEAQRSRVVAARAIETCERNLSVLEDAAPPRSAFEDWASSVRDGRRRFFACTDRNVLRWTDEAGLLTDHDEQAAAERADLGFTPGAWDNVNAAPGMLVIDGARSPWLLRRVLRAIAGGSQGYTPRVHVVEPQDATAVLDTLAMHDLREPLCGASVRWLIGDGSVDELERALSDAWRWELPGGVISTRHTTTLDIAIERARVRQQARYRALCASTQTHDAPTTRADWDARFAEARDETGAPLRVLLPTTRYSTYVRHSMEDLAGAIRRSGHEATVLVEPERDVRIAATFELDAHDSIRPDLTIVANWPRASRRNCWPEGAPAVCWVQDMLGHLFDPRLGAAQGELDFVVGLVNGALIRDCGYPKARAAFLATPVCPQKFHDLPADASIEPVDVAYVSHQSEPPEAMAERLRAAFGASGGGAVITRIEAALAERLRAGDTRALEYEKLEILTTECVGGANTPGAAVNAGRVLMMVTFPLAERMWRRQSVEWASAICQRHGLTLGLFGAGWERTPFAAHARGRITHDDTLRSVYQNAGCHLHASLSSNAHQRVFECALSGGLMLRRGPSPDRVPIEMMQRAILTRREPDLLHRNGADAYLFEPGRPALEPDAGLFDRARLDEVLGNGGWRPWVFEKDGTRCYADATHRAAIQQAASWTPELPLEQFPDWSYDNARQTLFETEEQLEAMILRAAGDDAWRRSTIDHHRARALSFNTTDVFWSRTLDAVANSLSRGEA